MGVQVDTSIPLDDWRAVPEAARRAESLGFSGVTDVRQGKRFELELEGAPQRLRIDNVSSSPHAWLRVARVRLFERRAEGVSAA